MKVFALGGSSSIGQAAIRVLIDAGHEVCATYRSGVPGGLDSATWVRADVRSTDDLDALAGPAEGADVLLLLPGLSMGRTIATYDDDLVSEVVDVNFSGQFRAIQRIAPVLADGSQIIILGSLAGQRGAGDPLYGATKGAMHALAKSLAKSLAPRTRVNVVAPGMVTGTAMHDGTPPAVLDMHIKTTPTGHFISAADLARVLLDIMQPHWSQLNGACIDLNGGMYVR
ncbi:MAG: SDR family NAD(P)-dependent oxidoreductase [Chloroflexota bacterium]|nr:SDR family NAD(P)-dependent oxidoreductase [Chloroflexota bacterium]MDE2884702.1 SDR family NAD(P)-dependent oxidoreductase [Chloroflexota bacterium]